MSYLRFLFLEFAGSNSTNRFWPWIFELELIMGDNLVLNAVSLVMLEFN